jgi:hypothetical protein
MKVSPGYGLYSTAQVSVTTKNKFLLFFIRIWLFLNGYKEVNKFTEPDRTRYGGS